jgi:hypothetical protein
VTVTQTAGTPYGIGALKAAGERVATATVGCRNVTLFEAAWSMGRLLGGGQLDSSAEVRAFLVELGCGLGLPHAEVHRQVRNGLNIGRKHPKTPPNPPTPARDDLDLLRSYRAVWEQAWSTQGRGPSYSTTLRIIAALCLCGVRSGEREFPAGHRKLADLSGVSPGTVSKHLARVGDWFVRTDPGDRTQARPSSWRLSVGNTSSTKPKEWRYEGVFPFDRPLLEPSHAVWWRWSNGWRLFCLLAAGVNDVPTLATRMGLSTRAVARNLTRLADRELASPTPEGWVAVFDRFDEASVAHVVEAREERRRRERRQYLHYLVWQQQIEAQRKGIDPRTGEILPPGKLVVLGPGMFLAQLPTFWRDVLLDEPPRRRRKGSLLVSASEAAARWRFCQEHREYVNRVVERRKAA